MRRFFLSTDQIDRRRAILSGADAHHARNVLRLGPGDRIEVVDGSGNQYEAQILGLEENQVRLSIVGQLRRDSEPYLELTLAQGYLKDKKMDSLIRPLTELGTARWIPFTAHRSVVVPPAARLTGRYQRWEKISREAVKQCKRSRPMQIEKVMAFEETLGLSSSYELKIMFYEQATGPQDWQSLISLNPLRVFVMIGPEGGFEADEIAAARTAGFHTMGMGPRILRAETAALAACTMVQMMFGDMGQVTSGRQKSP
jgi:16S rRNA (uracil1498-N3)-methyltransferase